jgi:hypothetical protein
MRHRMHRIGDDETSGDDILGGGPELLGDDLAQLFAGDDYFSGYGGMMGADTILGADMILGADPRVAALAKRAHQAGRVSMARQVQQAKAAGGLVVQQKPNTFAGEQVLPLSTTAAVGAGLADTAEGRPQRTIRCDRFVVPSTLSPFFLITQLNVGQEPQFVATGTIDAEIFSQSAFGVELKGSTATLGTVVSVGVINQDTNPHFFRAAIIGPTVY